MVFPGPEDFIRKGMADFGPRRKLREARGGEMKVRGGMRRAMKQGKKVLRRRANLINAFPREISPDSIALL